MKQTILSALLLCSLLPAARAVDIQRWQTPSGSRVLLIERHENPIVDISVQFDGSGHAADAPGQNGTADFAAALLTNGTAQLDEEAFNRRADDLAISIGSSSDSEAAALSLRSLSRPQTLQPALTLLHDAIVSPRYDAQVFHRTREQAILGLKQQESNPAFIASREADKLDYPGHPYSADALTSTQSLQAVSLDAVKTFHRSHYGKNNAVIALVGDLTRSQAEDITRQLLDSLPERAETAAIPPVAVHSGQQRELPFASEQAQIVMSMPLISRKDPDYFALVAGNYILGGGGFDSRLMKVLRDQKGYVYGVSSSLLPQREPGQFSIRFATKKANADDALQQARQVLRQMIQEGPSEAELQQAKDNIIGSFPLRFDTNAKLIGYLAMIGLYDLPGDWLDQYPQKIAALTTADIKAAWQKRVRPENLNTVIVGR